MKKTNSLIVLLITMVLIVACSSTEPAVVETSSAGQSEEAMDDEMMDTEDAMAEDASTEETMDEDMKDDSDMESADEHMESEDTTDSDAMHEEDMDGEMMDRGDGEHEDAMAEEDSMAENAEGVMEDDEEAMSGEEEMAEMMERPVWHHISLTNARTGEMFTLADFSGKTVFVEPMATWCTNCLRQLMNVRETKALTSDADTIYVALSLETNISDQTLANYAEGQGFDWLFAVMTPEMLEELAAAFGRSITSAPSTPHFIIRPDGSFTDLTTGIESPDQILQQIQAAKA